MPVERSAQRSRHRIIRIPVQTPTAAPAIATRSARAAVCTYLGAPSHTRPLPHPPQTVHLFHGTMTTLSTSMQCRFRRPCPHETTQRKTVRPAAGTPRVRSSDQSPAGRHCADAARWRSYRRAGRVSMRPVTIHRERIGQHASAQDSALEYSPDTDTQAGDPSLSLLNAWTVAGVAAERTQLLAKGNK